jgi:hypothetical protein
VGGITVSEVPGTHDSMVLEPNVRVLAARLRACIEEAEGQIAAGRSRSGSAEARVATAPVPMREAIGG